MKKQILLIEDEPANSDMLEFLLQREDCVFDRASDGDEGIQKVREKAYDVIFLDLIMKRMSGWEAFDILVKEVPQIPVIIVSALDRSAGRWAGLRDKGAFAYSVKPVDLEEVRLAFQNALEEREKRLAQLKR